MFNAKGIVHSIKEQGLVDIKILEKIGDNQYIAEYNGRKYTAIFNWFTSCYYVDDIYGAIEAE